MVDRPQEPHGSHLTITVRHAGQAVSLETNLHQKVKAVLERALEQLGVQVPANDDAVLQFGDVRLSDLDQTLGDYRIPDHAVLDLVFVHRAGSSQLMRGAEDIRPFSKFHRVILLDAIRRFVMAPAIIEETVSHLAAHGQAGNEGVVYWAARAMGDHEASVTRVIHPNQKASPAGVEVDARAQRAINELLWETGEVLVAQVHSHPAGVFHSTTDDDHPATFLVGFLSVVVGFYGQQGMGIPATWAVWRHRGLGRWLRLDASALSGLFDIKGIAR